ncbi:MAG: type II toxin-antitoxin system VapC family toxin [Polyangiales bacterium]
MTCTLLSDHDLQTRLETWQRFPLRRWQHRILLSRAIAYRHRLTVYDALYLTLAEALQIPLLTADAAFFNVHAETEVVRC